MRILQLNLLHFVTSAKACNLFIGFCSMLIIIGEQTLFEHERREDKNGCAAGEPHENPCKTTTRPCTGTQFLSIHPPWPGISVVVLTFSCAPSSLSSHSHPGRPAGGLTAPCTPRLRELSAVPPPASPPLPLRVTGHSSRPSSADCPVTWPGGGSRSGTPQPPGPGAAPSRAGPSRAEPSRAEPSRAAGVPSEQRWFLRRGRWTAVGGRRQVNILWGGGHR